MDRRLPMMVLAVGAFVSLSSSLALAQSSDQGVAFFESRIRPVLAQNCYKCHSAQAEKLKGRLLLDTREGVLKGGENGPALVPGKPEESRLIRAVRYADEDLQMPPKQRLPDAAVADLVKWIQMGAPDPRAGGPSVAAANPKPKIDIAAGKSYWAFQPLQHTPPPAVKNQAWVRTPVDRFVLARLEEKGLVPNPAASPEVLVRRAYYDLTGLPPTPEEIQAFLDDTSFDAWGRLIDKLLASDRYGERWGRHWLDLARFAESGGYEFDKDRPGAFEYRDFVIRAFNGDMPFNQFVRLQVAGDKLAPGDYLAGCATGYLVAGPYPGQITQKTEEPIRYDQLDDMVSTLSTSLLGLTVGCARCHDHKYDPIPTRDYYRLAACLGQTDSGEARLDPKPEIFRKLKADYDAAHAPLAAAWQAFAREQLPARVQKWTAEQPAGAAAATWLTLQPVSADSTKLVAHSHLHGITGVRVEFAEKRLPVMAKPPAGNAALAPPEFEMTVAPEGDRTKRPPVPLKRVQTADIASDPENPDALPQTALYETEADTGIPEGATLTLTVKAPKGRAVQLRSVAITTMARPVSLSANIAPQAPREVAELLAEAKGQVDDKNRDALGQWLRAADPEVRRALDPLMEHAAKEPKPNLSRVFAAADKPGAQVYFLKRGEVPHKDGLASPGFLQVLMNDSNGGKHWTETSASSPPASDPRVALASWLTDADQGAGQLLARVIVNRLWQHHLGRGIVATPNDFGVQGEPPANRELLDYLASELIRSGWQLKSIQRLICTSAVYMQDSTISTEAEKADPDNRLVWHHPPQRLEAEAIRDALLSVGGNLSLTMYGPGTLSEDSVRRSVYLTVKRSKIVPMLQVFNAPDAIAGVGVRQTTTVATQALTMMNSPFVRQQAEKLAARVRPSRSTDLGAAIDQAYVIAYGRHASAADRQEMTDFISRQTQGYGAAPNAPELAMADFCQVLLCSSEFVYVD